MQVERRCGYAGTFGAGKRPYRRCCSLRRKQAALAGGGSGDRRLQATSEGI